MPVSDKLAHEIYIISIFHVISLVLLFSFCFYIYLRAKKTPLLFSYLSVAGMIGLWIVSKILKTVTPTVEHRWFFIVTQYFGVEFLGYCLLIFAYIYSKDRLPSRKQLVLWSIPPMAAFAIIVTNPVHMGFYSYFDFYKDRFGVLFYPTQIVQYLFWLVGIIMLSGGFTKQRAFQSKKAFGRLFAVITLIPLLTNLYYILYKLNVFPWIFPFPVFDITPVAGTIALILFTIPAYKFRFFDISPVSYEKLYNLTPYGMVFMNKKRVLYDGNKAFYDMFHVERRDIELNSFAENALGGQEGVRFVSFVDDRDSHELELMLEVRKSYRIKKTLKKNGVMLLYFYDITEANENHALLVRQNTELNDINRRLDNMADSTKALAVARTKSQIAQNVHDILGHSLTVVIGMTELAAADDSMESAQKRLDYADELLSSSLNDLKSAIESDGGKWEKTSLINAIEHLKNESILVDIAIHGEAYELSSTKTEALFRLCQEAVTNSIKHGKAKTFYIILRFKKSEVEVFAIDNGSGCKSIVKSFGLTGIEKRIHDLKGYVEFGSDGECGFTIHAVLPR